MSEWKLFVKPQAVVDVDRKTYIVGTSQKSLQISLHIVMI